MSATSRPMTDNDRAHLYIWAISYDLDSDQVDEILDRAAPDWRYRLTLQEAQSVIRDWHNFAPYRRLNHRL